MFCSRLIGGAHELLFELASLITIMLLGHWMEMKSVAGAQGALKELSKLLPIIVAFNAVLLKRKKIINCDPAKN